MLKVRKKESKKDHADKTFLAYIVKGNRQIIQRDISASKRFQVDGYTYLVMDQAIFYKNIDGHLRSVSYYRENNPKPYNFNGVNTGLDKDELDSFFAEDLFHIVNDIKPETKTLYIFVMSIFNLAICIMFMVIILMQEFFL